MRDWCIPPPHRGCWFFIMRAGFRCASPLLSWRTLLALATSSVRTNTYSSVVYAYRKQYVVTTFLNGGTYLRCCCCNYIYRHGESGELFNSAVWTRPKPALLKNYQHERLTFILRKLCRKWTNRRQLDNVLTYCRSPWLQSRLKTSSELHKVKHQRSRTSNGFLPDLNPRLSLYFRCEMQDGILAEYRIFRTISL